MSELVARGFLRALFHAAQGLLRYPPEHESVRSAVSALQSAAEVLTSGQPEAVITLELRVQHHCSRQEARDVALRYLDPA